MKKLIYLLLTVYTFAPQHAHAWGKRGHDIAGELAWHFLDDASKAKLQRYLGTTTIDEASNWMDEMRRDHSYDHMKPWHYVDFERGTDYVPNNDENLVNELNKVIEELQHKDGMDAEQIKTDLMILIHIVEDMHQPLHVGYPGDKGGNTIKVTYLDKHTNLHHVWDDNIIQTSDITYDKCLAQLSNIPKGELTTLKKVNVVNWLKEPRQLLPGVYDLHDDTIDEAYIVKNTPVVEKQLLIAGIRLASVLEMVLR